MASSDGAVDFDDGRHLDGSAIKAINQQWIDREMRARESEFTEEASGSVFVGTWNVNAKKQEGDLDEWLLHGAREGSGGYADIYAVGFQEIVDLNAVNVLADNKTQKVSHFWEGQIKSCLESTQVKYVHIMTQSLVGVLVCIYAKEAVAQHIKDVRGTTYAVGILGLMGNKGGASIRLNFYDTSICFMCGHFAAHRDKVNDRNRDFKNIYEKSVFHFEHADESSKGTRAGDVSVIIPRYGADLYLNQDVNIPDHDLIWFFGDFNYRIDEEYTTAQVFEKLAEGKEGLEALKVRDQLNIERNIKGTVFQGFEEAELHFQPTYKYQPGTDIYDQRPDKKVRPPAWCDRILTKSSKPGTIRQHFYKRAELKPSDHKPVMALFDVKLLRVVKSKFNTIFEMLKNELEFWTNLKRPPVCKITSNVEPEVEKNAGNVSGEVILLHFENLKYAVGMVQTITIKNVGDSLAHWRFIPKTEDTSVCKRWISVSKSKGLLKGNETVEITFTCRIDKKTAQNLNSGADSLDDVIILRLENGFDFYIGVTGTYDRSCFGMSLNDLARNSTPVRQTSLPVTFELSSQFYTPAFKDQCAIARAAAPVSSQVPKELWRVVDALFSGRALRERDLFSSGATEAIATEAATIRECLDTGSAFPAECNPHALAEVMVTFLAALPEPVLPATFYPDNELDPSRIRGFCRKIFESSEFPTLNYNVFVYVISFLKEIINAQSGNNLSSEHGVLLIEHLCVVCISSLTNLEIAIDNSNRQKETAAVISKDQSSKDQSAKAGGGGGGGGVAKTLTSAAAAASGKDSKAADSNAMVSSGDAKVASKVKALLEIFKYLLTSTAI